MLNYPPQEDKCPRMVSGTKIYDKVKSEKESEKNELGIRKRELLWMVSG